MKRSDFFKGMWLSPLAIACGPRTPLNSSSTVDAQGDAALVEVLTTTAEPFNVRSFGAVDDGMTDDSAAWLATIAAMPATGGMLDARGCSRTVLNETIVDGGKGIVILLGAGTFTCTPSTNDHCFNLTGESSVFGMGRSTTIISNQGTAANCITINGVRSTIAEVGMSGGSVVRTAGSGINALGNAKVFCHRVDATGHTTGFRFDSMITSVLRECVAAGGTDGFGLYHTTQTSTSVHYDSCYAVGCSRYGYYIDGQANYIKYSNCAADNSSGGWTNAYFFNNNDSRVQSVTLDTCAHEDLSDSSAGASIKAIDVEGLTIINPYLWRPGTGDNDAVIDLRGCVGVTILNPFHNRRSTNDISITNSATPITSKNIVINAGVESGGIDLVISDTNSVAIVLQQGAAVSDVSGGSTIDTEARRAINDLLARLRTHGLIAS